MDKLQSIRFFLKVSETLSFKHAAIHFGVPASTVSRAIKGLEEELGVVLFERTTRQVRLTEAGGWYSAEVVDPIRALAAADDMGESTGARAGGYTASLRYQATAKSGSSISSMSFGRCIQMSFAMSS